MEAAAVEMGEEEMGEGIGVHPLVLGGGGIGGPHGGAGGGACGSSASSSADAFVVAFGEPPPRTDVFWTNAEDDIIKNSVAELGNQWSLIASRLPGRTAAAIRARHERIRHRNTRIIQGSGVHTPAIGGVGGIGGPHGGAGGTEDIDDSLVSTVTSTVASISHQPSATSHQPSATSHQPSAKNFKVGDLVFCRLSPTTVCRRHSVFIVVQDGRTAGNGCITGQFIIRLVRPHPNCNLDPDHLLTVMVNGDNLEHVGHLPLIGHVGRTGEMKYSQIGLYKPFVQEVTRMQLDEMLMEAASKTITSGHPTFPVLPPPFKLFKLTKGMGMERAAEFLYHSRGAQNWAHHHVHYVLLTFWLWETSTDGQRTTGLLNQPILVVKNGVTGRYTTTSNHKTIPLAAASLGKYTGIAHVGPT